MAEQDNILTKLHDLLLYVVPVLAKFPRDHKFTLGDRVLLRLLDVQECCVMAYYGRDKAGPLTEANLHLEMARHQVRLAHDLKLVSHHQYEVLAGKMEECGRMVGGWLKSAVSRRKPPPSGHENVQSPV
jgi:hypothetical protein